MATPVGFRSYTILSDVTVGELDKHGACIYVEVTNDGTTDALFFPNSFPNQGHQNLHGIPVKAGTTRQIPLAVYNFKSTVPVTVIGYRM